MSESAGSHPIPAPVTHPASLQIPDHELSCQTSSGPVAQEAEQRKVAEAEQSNAEKQRKLAAANFQKARNAVDDWFTTISQTTLLDAPGLQPLRKELLEAALSYYKNFAEQAQNEPELRADLAAAHLRLSVILTSLDRNDDALVEFLRGLEQVEQLTQQRHLFGTNGALLTTFTNPSPAYSSTGFKFLDFGASVTAVGNDRVLIGADNNDAPNGTRFAGTAYLFSTNGTLLATNQFVLVRTRHSC